MSTERLEGKRLVAVLVLFVVIIAVSAFGGWYFGYYRIRVFKNGNEINIQDYYAVLDIVKSDYDGEIEQTKLLQGSINGAINSLNDPYSYYVNKEEYQRIQNEVKGEFVGLGIIYNYQKDFALITAVLPNSPALEAGLIPGDQIIKVNETSVKDFKNIDELRNALKGKEGDTAKLTLKTDNAEKTVNLTHKQFIIENTILTIEDGIGIIRIFHFSNDFKDEFKKVSDALIQNNITKVILDLRGNGGGTADMGVYLADQFIKEGILVKEKRKAEKEERAISAKEGDPLENVQVVILTNIGTASEAEVLASALSENNRAKIIGQNTAGKGTEQTNFELSDGSAIHITVGKWFTPKGNWIDRVGIKPDILIEKEFFNQPQP